MLVDKICKELLHVAVEMLSSSSSVMVLTIPQCREYLCAVAVDCYSYNILKTFVTETGVVVSLDVAQVAKCPVQYLFYHLVLSQSVLLH